MNEKYATAQALSDEKILLTEKALGLINKHLKRLDETITVAVKEVSNAPGVNID